MNDIDMEEKLLKNGFTTKEIDAIIFWANRDNVSCSVIIIQIRRVFIGILIILSGLITLLISEFFRLSGGAGFYALLTGFFLCVITAFIITPVKLGAKITLHFKKIM